MKISESLEVIIVNQTDPLEDRNAQLQCSNVNLDLKKTNHLKAPTIKDQDLAVRSLSSLFGSQVLASAQPMHAFNN